MAHYLFQAIYHGEMVTADVGEEFATLNEAEAYAAIVAEELGRHSPEVVTVSVLSEDGIVITGGIAARS